MSGNGLYGSYGNNIRTVDAAKLIGWQDRFQMPEVHQGRKKAFCSFDRGIITAGFNKYDIAKLYAHQAMSGIGKKIGLHEKIVVTLRQETAHKRLKAEILF